ncbi:acetyltransferase [Aequorivita echinoideorum]|uniref:Acetyltransferase n=1 Tax=Aequorivita echinoideorum TaxID=1549647 RepID=A0ABS5S3Y7_9FLAO|nr:acetyltransferase [Aequorivita echinoideorum]
MLIYGAGGHSKVIIETLLTINPNMKIQVYDDDVEKKQCLDFPVIHDWESISENSQIVFGLGNNNLRASLASTLKSKYKFCEAIIHPSSVVSQNSNIGKGTVIFARVVVNADSQVGEHCILNTGSIIEHDCIIDDFVHISPGAILAGGVQIGRASHIGMGAQILPLVKVGVNCIIGAGAVILRDVPDGSTVVGNPGKILSK